MELLELIKWGTLFASGFFGGLGFNLWVKSIDYSLEKHKFYKNKIPTLKEVLIEAPIDLLHHMPLWCLVAFLSLWYQLMFDWMNWWLLAFSGGNIIADLPSAKRRYSNYIRMVLKYFNPRKIAPLLVAATAVASGNVVKGVQQVVEIAAKDMNIQGKAANAEDVQKLLQQQYELLKKQLEQKK